MTVFGLIRIAAWLKRIALALEERNVLDRLRYERDYPPPGVEPPPRRKFQHSRLTPEELDERRRERKLETLGLEG